MLNTVIHHVAEDLQNCPVPLWWPKVKTRTDGPFRLNVFWVSAQDDCYSETVSPPKVGPFATLSQLMRVSGWLQCGHWFDSLRCILASRSFVGMRTWMTINQIDLMSSEDQTACRFLHTLDHGVAGCCVMIRMSRAPFSASDVMCSAE